MAKITTNILYSKLNFLNHRRQFQHLAVQNEQVEDIDDFRTRGSEILKAMTTAPESLATKSPPIRRDSHQQTSAHLRSRGKSETELKKNHKASSKFQQKQEELLLVEDAKKNSLLRGNERENKVKKLKYLKRTIELARRKRFDNQGSFAANMVTYRGGKHKTGPKVNENSYGNGEKRSCQKCETSGSIKNFGHDDRSRTSESTCVTNDVTLQVIDEETSYYNAQ